jgi:hypothetical protein
MEAVISSLKDLTASSLNFLSQLDKTYTYT